MPRLTGIFDNFRDLDKISIADIASWLKIKGDIHSLTNFIGNKIIYPQTIPLKRADLEVELAILHEAIKNQPEIFYSPSEKKITIPQEFKERFPPLSKLVTVIIESLNPRGITLVFVKNKNIITQVGTIISPDLKKLPFSGGVPVFVNNTPYNLASNSLNISEVKDANIKLRIGNEDLEVSGGELGIIIDLRGEK